MAIRSRIDTVFNDVCAVSALATSNAVDWARREEREKQYLDIVGRYTHAQVQEFPILYALLVQQLEQTYGDALGRLYTSLELEDGGKAQFLTPESVCDLLAKMTMTEDMVGMVQAEEFVTALEPCAGSGRMMIALAKAFLDVGLNPQTQLHVTAIDLDPTMVHMTYLQLSLLGIPAVVYHGNALSNQMFSCWLTPIHIMFGWTWKLRRARERTTERRTISLPDRPLTVQLNLFTGKGEEG